MGTSFLTQWVSDNEINAICWTLIHSLWIGLAVALSTGLVITFTRKSSAVLRYRLLCGILVLFVMSAIVTFCVELRSANNVHLQLAPAASRAPRHDVFVMNQQYEAGQVSLVKQGMNLLNQYTGVIFLVWLLFFVMKSLKMVGGLLYIQRIRNHKLHEVAEEFKHKIELFSRQIGIRQTVRLVQSELVKVPVAVGWLKPVILLPVGIILQLSTEQLESILWHELAHIRRRDYLVNILQGMVETVFFFNPGLLWLSSLIRAEREACCDDMVLSRMPRKANYLEALLAFGYGEFNQAGLAMSIGTGNQLRNRLKRMINQENKRLSMVEKVVLSAGLILLSAFTTIPKNNPITRHLTNMFAKSATAIKKPVKMEPVKSGPLSEKKKIISIAQKSLFTDTIIKRDTAINFKSVLFKDNDIDIANTDISAMDDKGNKYHFIVADSKLVAMELNGVKINESALNSNQYLVTQIYQVMAQKRRVRQDDIAMYKASSPDAKFKFKADKGKYTTSYVPDPRYMKDDNMHKRMQDDSANYEKERGRAIGVISDLVSEKVVANAAAVQWFGLSDTEFIVNGEKQPDALHEKLKAKYGIHENYGLYYGPVKMTGTGVFIDRDDERRHNLERIKTKNQQFNFQRPKLGAPDQYADMQQRNMVKLKMQQRRMLQPRFSLNPIIANVIDDLVIENVVKDKGDLRNFNLTNSSLMVNGVKQPGAIHEKLKRKYITEPKYQMEEQIIDDPDFGLHYDNNGGMGIGITHGGKY